MRSWHTWLWIGAFFLAAFTGIRYLDGPPPGHTGGFGEQTCQTCHFGSDLNPGSGSLMLNGIDAVVDAGQSYPLSIVLHSENLVVGGFQMTARTRQGENAGSFQPGDMNAEVVLDTTGIQYIQHTLYGVENALVRDGKVIWELTWVAPDVVGDSIVFNLAANAANGDNSAFGDEIFTFEKIVDVQ